MDQFRGTPQRLDPYKNIKYCVKWGGRYVAGFSKVSSMEPPSRLVDYRDVGHPTSRHKWLGLIKSKALTWS